MATLPLACARCSTVAPLHQIGTRADDRDNLVCEACAVGAMKAADEDRRHRPYGRRPQPVRATVPAAQQEYAG